MRKIPSALAVLVSAAAVGSEAPHVYAQTSRDFAPGQSELLPPGQAKKPGESAREFAPGRQNREADQHDCHPDVQRHLHSTYSHSADHYHRRSDCHPIVI